MNNNNINVSNILESLIFFSSTSPKTDYAVQAERILAEHLAKAFDLIDRASTKVSTNNMEQ